MKTHEILLIFNDEGFAELLEMEKEMNVTRENLFRFALRWLHWTRKKINQRGKFQLEEEDGTTRLIDAPFLMLKIDEWRKSSPSVILNHKEEKGPTKSEIKQAVIQRLLDIEYAPGTKFHKEDPDTWDRERQMLVLRVGWNNMTLEELIAGLPE